MAKREGLYGGLLMLLCTQTGWAAVAQIPELPPEVPRSSGEIKIDGELGDAEWQGAVQFELPYNTRPGENTPAPVKTIAYLTYDERNFYVAFKAFDPEPEKIRAHFSDRDSAYNDDFIGIVIDTFNDERRGFEFFTNPLGAQMDLFFDGVSGSESDAWDAIWDARGQITGFGYSVEIAIPWQSLRFPDGGSEKIWGIDLIRFWPREHRYRLSVHPMERGNNCYLCQSIKVRGMAGITPGNNLLITPTLTASRTDMRDPITAPMQRGDTQTDAGVTVEWGVTPNIIASGTINPDFSQVEADVAQLDVNNQFALFYNEQRPFFLEGADFFETLLDIVYTRNIADPDWGAKLTGKEGDHAFGAFATDDQITNLVFPGSQGSDIGSFDFASRAQVARYRQDVGNGSTIGALATDRRGGGYSNTVSGADGKFRFGENDFLAWQALHSRTEYNADMQAQFGVPAGVLQDTAYYMNYDHSTRNYGYWGEYFNIGEDFRADLGFLPRVGYDMYLGGGRYTWYGDAQNWYTEYGINGDWDLTHDSNGQLLEREIEAYLHVNSSLQSYLELGGLQSDVFYNGSFFDRSYVSLYGEVRPADGLFAALFVKRGDDIDFENTRPGKLAQFEPTLGMQLGRHLNADLSHIYEKFDVAGGRLYTANLSELRMAWQFNLRTYVRIIAQYQDIERNPALYLDPVDARSRSLAGQVLFSYKVNPQTVMYAGYSSGYIGDQQRDLTKAQQTFFLKLSYAWQT